MARLRSLGTAGLLRLSACALVACNAIAGIGAPELETVDGGSPSLEDSGAPLTDSGGSIAIDSSPRADSGDGGSMPDAEVADTNIPDTNVPDTNTPPPPASKPGFDISAGGTYGKSAGFTLIGVVGESPGGNNVGSSAHFMLKAGVIATTQPN